MPLFRPPTQSAGISYRDTAQLTEMLRASNDVAIELAPAERHKAVLG